MKDKKVTIKITIILLLIVIIFFLSIFLSQEQEEVVDTTSNINVSNKKIGWGIKRNDKHEQPDVGKENKKVLDENNGICLGNNEQKVVYLTFDEGYEAGYTEEILRVLKDNDVKATFFITAHYVNTQEDLVKKMIEEGHIVGNHTLNYLMSGKLNIIKI